LTLDERELANLTVSGDPQVFGLLPSAVDAALDHDLAPLERLVTVSRIDEVRQFVIAPSLFDVVAGEATSCHDYPRPYDHSAAPTSRRVQYERAVAALDPTQFRPFAARAWLGTEIDAGPKCLRGRAVRPPALRHRRQRRPYPGPAAVRHRTPLHRRAAPAARWRRATLPARAAHSRRDDTHHRHGRTAARRRACPVVTRGVALRHGVPGHGPTTTCPAAAQAKAL
jgi:hypothetical protein